MVEVPLGVRSLMEYVYAGLFGAIFIGIYVNYRLVRELAGVVQATAQQLDANLAEALKNVVEELPFGTNQANPWAGIVADIVKSNINRSENGRFISAEIIDSPKEP